MFIRSAAETADASNRCRCWFKSPERCRSQKAPQGQAFL
ncbi:uncharacterized protein DNG_05133 [Cephalotrichum gorgonifer]|uniref:Uncharacterized protein n=1 Tax=Cephalotrichum gorgonifer TaxID=2041049 RepID=A0AAE8SV77_9PEZI|nr:uncharacterized protein DNG_05133 [Cephalotrichum gorgonifer]